MISKWNVVSYSSFDNQPDVWETVVDFELDRSFYIKRMEGIGYLIYLDSVLLPFIFDTFWEAEHFWSDDVMSQFGQ